MFSKLFSNRVPDGHVAFQNGKVFRAGERVKGEADLYRPRIVPRLIRTRFSAFQVVWTPDLRNFQAFVDAGDEEGVNARLAELLELDPSADVDGFARYLGISIVEFRQLRTQVPELQILGEAVPQPALTPSQAFLEAFKQWAAA